MLKELSSDRPPFVVQPSSKYHPIVQDGFQFTVESPFVKPRETRFAII